MATESVLPEQASIWPQDMPHKDAELKPWVTQALRCIGGFLGELSTQEKDALFGVMCNNPERLCRWQAEGHFASLPALQAKIRDWKARGLAGLTGSEAQCAPQNLYGSERMAEYLREIREQVCSRCIEKPPGGPPCAPLGRRCGLELHFEQFVTAVHDIQSPFIGPYLDHDRSVICCDCEQQGGSECPCPMDYLAVLGVQAIETVDQRHAQKGIPADSH